MGWDGGCAEHNAGGLDTWFCERGTVWVRDCDAGCIARARGYGAGDMLVWAEKRWEGGLALG